MEELRLPWNNKEGVLYGGIIALITAFLMMTFNICKARGEVNIDCLRDSLIALPLIWILVMVLMTFLVGKIANIILDKVMAPTDSVNSRIALNIICCVTFMSMIITALGPLVGSIPEGILNLYGFTEWIQNWPINFCAAFWIEMGIAQPIARSVMKRKHIKILKEQNRRVAADE